MRGRSIDVRWHPVKTEAHPTRNDRTRMHVAIGTTSLASFLTSGHGRDIILAIAFRPFYTVRAKLNEAPQDTHSKIRLHWLHREMIHWLKPGYVYAWSWIIIAVVSLYMCAKEGVMFASLRLSKEYLGISETHALGISDSPFWCSYSSFCCPRKIPKVNAEILE